MQAMKPLSMFHPRRALQTAHNEAFITWRLLKSNGPAIIICHAVNLIARSLGNSISAAEISSVAPGVALCCFFYMYCFDIANQATSVTEDTKNKPDRPIPYGLLSVRGAYVRWALSWIIGPVLLQIFVGSWAGVHFVGLELWIFFCYVWPKPNHWFFRNAFTAVSNLQTSRLVDACVYHKVPKMNIGIGADIVVLVWVISTIHVQEFHDMEGDRESGRKTLPLILGSAGCSRLRIATASFLCCGGLWVLASSFGPGDFRLTSTLFATAVLHGISAMILAYRTTRLTSRQDDEQTYRIYYYIALSHLILFSAQKEYQQGKQ
ncbi:UbiA prenyltransferase family-domain-containing protein [Nemania sp. FL0916]|nr:UbiA prenyltransferase family-domain-containing protein [Nemania sp. FL0916]